MSAAKKKVLLFFGTRPEAIKMAPLAEELRRRPCFQTITVVSAQHRGMLDQVLRRFGLKAQADLDLMRESQSLFDITARLLHAFEPALEEFKPDLVLVHGDTTTTLGGALAAYYKRIPVGHVEAGLRTHDRYQPFPEEMNRRVTDALSTLYFAPTAPSRRALLREGVDPRFLFVTGNTVIDALLETAAKPARVKDPRLAALLRRSAGEGVRLILMTAHRRENFGAGFERLCSAVRALAGRYPNVHWAYPVHPNPNVTGVVQRRLSGLANVQLLAPLDYGDLVAALKRCALVVTDSGGLQEEAPSLGKPVLVLREVTERPEAVAAGTVRLVGTDPRKIQREAARLLDDARAYRAMANAVNPYGDGRASRRIADAVEWYFGRRKTRPSEFAPRRRA